MANKLFLFMLRSSGIVYLFYKVPTGSLKLIFFVIIFNLTVVIMFLVIIASVLRFLNLQTRTFVIIIIIIIIIICILNVIIIIAIIVIMC